MPVSLVSVSNLAQSLPSLFRRSLPIGTLAAVALVLCACSSDLDDAMHRGCAGLRDSAEAYAAGDRQALEAAKDDAEYLGMAAELSGDKGVDEGQVANATDAKLAFSALFSAAYDDGRNGELIWQGKRLDPQRQRTLQAGLETCDDY